MLNILIMNWIIAIVSTFILLIRQECSFSYFSYIIHYFSHY